MKKYANGTLVFENSTKEIEAEKIAHELGHWLGLFHTFDNVAPYDTYNIKQHTSVIDDFSNGMDYLFPDEYEEKKRIRWFKYQYNKVHEKLKNEVK
jgi:hypothetical protein